MEWLLVLALNLPMNEYHTGLRFSSYEACVETGSKILSGEMRPILVRQNPYRTTLRKALRDLADISSAYKENVRELGREKASKIRDRALIAWNQKSIHQFRNGKTSLTLAVIKSKVMCNQVRSSNPLNISEISIDP
jgi:hypothetical protein